MEPLLRRYISRHAIPDIHSSRASTWLSISERIRRSVLLSQEVSEFLAKNHSLAQSLLLSEFANILMLNQRNIALFFGG